jgi:hypothetical protein
MEYICRSDNFHLLSVLYKHMDGVTNDVERSNELVSVTIVTAVFYCSVAFFFFGRDILSSHFFPGVHPARGVRS